MDLQLSTLKKGFFITFAAYMLIGMHYFQHNSGGSGLHLPFNVVGWMFITPLIGFGLWQITLQRKVIYSSLTKLFVAATLLMLIPVLYANSNVVSESYTRLFGLIGGLLLFISLQQLQLTSKQRLLLLNLVLAAVFIEACFSLIQYYVLPVNNWVGYQKLANRPYGIFQQPNVAASFLTTGIALALYLLTQITESDKKQRWFYYATTFLATIPVILLQSRTGYLSLAFAPLLLLPWVYYQLKDKQQSRTVLIWITAYIVAVAIGLYTLESVEKVARSAATLTDPGARVPIYLHSLNMFLEKPLLGWGYGSFEVNYLRTYSVALQQGLALPGSPENLDHPHNELLYWGIEGGLIALAGIGLLVFGFVRILMKQSLVHALAIVGLLLPMLLHTQTEYPFYHSTAHWCVFLVLVWYIDNLHDKQIEVSFNYTFLLRTLALLTPIVSITFMATTLQANSLLTQYERSDRSDITPLTKVINPIAWITRLEFNAMMYRLRIALATNDTEELENYVNWAAEISQRTPRSNIYLTWVQALEKLQRPNQAMALLKHARVVYPNNKVIPKYLSYINKK